jgi:hypothetical protein
MENLNPATSNDPPIADLTQHPADGAGPDTELAALPAIESPRNIDLRLATLPAAHALRTIDNLMVRELKGLGTMFTPNVDAALDFFGLAYKPRGVFETQYQIIAGPLLNDPRVKRLASPVSFVPAFSWSTLEVVLAPYKLTAHGQRTLQLLRKLNNRFPNFKVLVEWVATRQHHVVRYSELSPNEMALIDGVHWPTADEVLEALGAVAFNNLDKLMAANEIVRQSISAREVN